MCNETCIIGLAFCVVELHSVRENGGGWGCIPCTMGLAAFCLVKSSPSREKGAGGRIPWG